MRAVIGRKALEALAATNDAWVGKAMGVTEGKKVIEEVSARSLQSIQLKLVKIGGKVISHARRTVFQLAEVAVSKAPFVKILARIHGLRYVPS